MIKNFLLLPIFFLLFSQQYHAQSNLTESEIEYLIQLGAQIEGTYQIQMIDTRALPTVELSLYKIIKEKRKSKKVVYHNINQNMRILILPKEVIESSDFNSVERIIYISSNNIEYEK